MIKNFSPSLFPGTSQLFFGPIDLNNEKNILPAKGKKGPK